MSKVICVSFQKTGTTSLGVALEKLGYDVVGYNVFRNLAQKKGVTWGEIESQALQVIEKYEAAKDTPWPLLYKKLDETYPGTRFIHVERDSTAWINSVVKDFSTHPNEIHRVIYGSDSPKGNEEAWLTRYNEHNDEVKAYFAGRPNDLLTLNLSRERSNWEKLCAFLDRSPPSGDWPHANTRAKKLLKSKSRRFLAQFGLR